MDFSNSEKYKKKAIDFIPGLAQTFSKAPYSYVEGVYPSFVKSGVGAYVTDVDNNVFLDYVLSLGPIVLGYNYPVVNDTIIETLKKGITFSMPHFYEIELAELMNTIVPSAEMTKFTKTGSDAVTAAVRAARAITGKEKIAYCGSGGVWHDWFICTTSRGAGVPKFNRDLIRIFEYNKIETLEKVFESNKDEIAAVCIEPSVLDSPQNNFLQKVKKITHENNAVLIFDEIVTGFRMALGGGQEYFDVIPDISCFGKGMANGMPLGAITGKKEYMKIFHEIFYSTTYAGEILSLAASMATINEIKEKNVVRYIWERGTELQKGFNKIIEQLDLPINIRGYPPRLKLFVKDENGNDSMLLISILFQECIKRRIMFGPGTIFNSFSHNSDDSQKTITVFSEACEVLKKAINSSNPKEFLKGKPMKPVLTFLDLKI